MLLQQYKLCCSKTANNNFQVSRVQAPMIRCCKLFKIIKLGLTAFLTVLSEHKKREKSVKYPCRPLARYSENTDEQKFITFLKVSICRHLGNYSVYVQLTQGVWFSFENPLNVLNASFMPKCDFAWHNGVTGRLMTARCCKKAKNSFIFIFCLWLLFFKFVWNTITFSLIK